MATKVNVTTLVMTDTWEKKYSTGSTGFFGKAVDPNSGKKYQITAAEIGSKPK